MTCRHTKIVRWPSTDGPRWSCVACAARFVPAGAVPVNLPALAAGIEALGTSQGGPYAKAAQMVREYGRVGAVERDRA